MKRILLSLLFIGSIVSGSFSSAADLKKNIQFSERVALNISAPSYLKALATSYISRELRTIPDVKVVDEKPNWEIYVRIIEPELESGQSPGFVMSLILTRCGVFCNDNPHCITKGGCKYISDNLMTIRRADFKERCRAIAAEFDTRIVGKCRKAFYKSLASGSERANPFMELIERKN